MSETVRRMLLQGIASLRAGYTSEGRRYLERVLYLDATQEQLAQAHLWLSRTTGVPKEKREHLESVLAIDPTNAEARREMAILEGRLDPDDVIDPDRAPLQAPEDALPDAPPTAPAQRLVCPRCAGQMRYEPDRTSVACAYCGQSLPIVSALGSQRRVPDDDFVVAMATSKGHTAPTGARGYRCQGCQASLLAAGEISTHCPYCGSSHVIEVDAGAAIAPEGLIPFAIERGDAQSRFRRWLDQQLREDPSHVTRVRGLYLPMWTFDLMGEVGWRSRESGDQNGFDGLSLPWGNGGLSADLREQLSGTTTPSEGSHYVLADNVVVPATFGIPYTLREVYDRFELGAVVPYAPSYLADWPAQIQQTTVADASLVARRRVLDETRAAVNWQAQGGTGSTSEVTTFPRSLSVQAYKLLLVPVWVANYRLGESTYTVVINGQTGDVIGEKPPSALKRLILSVTGRQD